MERHNVLKGFILCFIFVFQILEFTDNNLIERLFLNFELPTLFRNINTQSNQILDFDNIQIACLILARGGSKGIPHKNIAKLENTTLLGNTLAIITSFGKFNSVWVSTDDTQIVQESKKFNVSIHLREPFTAIDDAPSIYGVKEFIVKNADINIIGLIQCTSPFLRIKYLEQAFQLLQQGYHSVFSVSRQFKLRWKIDPDGKIVPDNFSPNSRPRRQDWSGEIIENGMFYFSYANLILESSSLQSGRLAIVEVPLNDSLEIDTPDDLIVANTLLERAGK